MRDAGRWRCRRWQVALGVAALAFALAASACGLLEDLPPVPTPTPVASNLFVNPGFEEGDAGWSHRVQPEWSAFAISDGFARTGKRALDLQLHGGPQDVGTHIVGGTQIVGTDAIPEFVSGYYYVDAWAPTASFQYLQMVISVKGADFDDDYQYHEIRVPIAGIDREPFLLSNARFQFLSRAAPKLRKWTYFSYPVRDAMQTLLGRVPATFESLEMFFEVRYDGKTAEQGETSAHVYYDDLYIGTQAGNPNRPKP